MPPLAHDIAWDAGDLGCGDLVLALRTRVRVAPGKVFKITALDAGASADIPAWCRMTGHALLAHDPGAHTFWVQAKPSSPNSLEWRLPCPENS